MSATHPKKVFRFCPEACKQWVAETLGAVFGWGPDAIRTVAGIARSHPLAARNWFAAQHAMRLDYFLNLMAADDKFCAEVLRAIGRDDLADAVDTRGALADVRRSLAKAQALLARHE